MLGQKVGESVGGSMHKGQCYGANGGNAESHHNCGGTCRPSYIKSNPYQSEAGYGGFTYHPNGAPQAHTSGIDEDDDEPDDSVYYVTGTSLDKKQIHYFAGPTISPELQDRVLPQVEEQVDQEHEEDYDEDIPPIDLSKTSSVASFKAETEQCVTEDGAPFTVTTIL